MNCFPESRLCRFSYNGASYLLHFGDPLAQSYADPKHPEGDGRVVVQAENLHHVLHLLLRYRVDAGDAFQGYDKVLQHNITHR